MRRQTRVSRASGAVVLSALALGASAAVAGAESQAEEKERTSWLPSLALSFDVHHQSLDVSGTSDLGFSEKQSENLLTSVFSVDGAISTPVLAEGFGAPRLFVQAGVQAPLSDETTPLKAVRSFPAVDPDTGGLPPETVESCPDLDAPKEACDHSLESKLTFNVSWSAGLGAEFTLPTPSRALKIRTSVDYFGQSLDFDGDAERLDRGGTGEEIEKLRIGGASTSKTLHALGPRVAFSGEVGRAGPLSFGVFAEIRLYWLLNDGDINYSATNTNGTASFVAEPDSFVAQGGAGLRITWVGSR